jgi:hypothetical protein
MLTTFLRYGGKLPPYRTELIAMASIARHADQNTARHVDHMAVIYRHAEQNTSYRSVWHSMSAVQNRIPPSCPAWRSMTAILNGTYNCNNNYPPLNPKLSPFIELKLLPVIYPGYLCSGVYFRFVNESAAYSVPITLWGILLLRAAQPHNSTHSRQDIRIFGCIMQRILLTVLKTTVIGVIIMTLIK